MPKRGLKKRHDGRYACRYKSEWFYGFTSDEALQQRDKYVRQIKSGLREETLGKTFDQYAVEWMQAYKSSVSIKTYNDYARYINFASTQIGAKRVRDITATDIQRLYQAKNGLSKSFLHKYSMLLKSMFSSAVEDGIILRNPCAKVKTPAAEEGTHRALEQWERDLISAMLGKHDMALATMLMLYAGLRRGEVLAFNIDRDVDFTKGIITVKHAIAFNYNQPTKKGPKSKAGEREIYLFAPLRKALEGKSGLVLPNKDGGVMSKSAWNSKWRSYIRAIERMLNGCQKGWYGKTAEHREILAAGENLPPWHEVNIRSHDFRHSFCTMLYDAGVDIKTAMKWMGHSDEKMIMHIYAHLSEKKEKAASIAVGQLLDEVLCSQNGSQTEIRAVNPL